MTWTKELIQSYQHQASIKNDQKDCISCDCPITNEDYEKYKMCPWCYSQLDTSLTDLKE